VRSSSMNAVCSASGSFRRKFDTWL
jgi:hypothetical protein